MISPTGLGIRRDTEGHGDYGAPRNDRLHNGIDYLCSENSVVVAPFDMKITRIAKPKAGSNLSGISFTAGKSKGKMFYFEPDPWYIGETVLKGTIIGIAQSVSKDYGLPGMKDHIHFQIDK